MNLETINVSTTDGRADIALADCNAGTFLGVRSQPLDAMLWTKLTAWNMARMVYLNEPVKAAFAQGFMAWRGHDDGPDFEDPILPADIRPDWLPDTLRLPRTFHRVSTVNIGNATYYVDEAVNEAARKMRAAMDVHDESMAKTNAHVDNGWKWGVGLLVGGIALLSIAMAL